MKGYPLKERLEHARQHWDGIERAKRLRPFLRYVCILDEATNPDHRLRHNLVLPVDHSCWDVWAPPCRPTCRCTLQSLSERDIQRLVAEGEALFFEAPTNDMHRLLNVRTGEVSELPRGILPGFEHNLAKPDNTHLRKAALRSREAHWRAVDQ